MEKSKNIVINLANYNVPQIEESYSKNYVTFGEHNSYYSHLTEAYNGSPTNRSVVNAIALMIYGKGLEATDEDENIEEVTDLFSKDLLKKISLDLKLYGQACYQVGWDEKHENVIKTEYLPVTTTTKGKLDKMGKSRYYYYMPDWTLSYNTNPKRIPAFGTSKSQIELVYIQIQTPGLMYYSLPDYQAGLQYCKIEEEVSNFHINNVMNGFTPGMMINFNNGVLEEEAQRKIEQDVVNKWGGSSNAGKIIMTFNDDATNAPTLENVQLSDADKQYQFIADEAMRKILISHRVTSPMLLGIKDNTGLGNNADELVTAFQLFNATVIRPFQDLIIDSLNDIQKVNGWDYDLYFKTLQPIEFTEDGTDKGDKDEVEKETGVEQSMSAIEDYSLLDALAEDMPEGYDIHLVEDVGEETEDLNYENLYNELHLADVESAPIKKSTEDTPLYKVRYRYKKVHPKSTQRDFCTKVHALGGQNKYFRKEDINFMSFKGVNKSHGHNGKAYSIWKYKGGVNCGDAWERVIFKKKVQADGTPYIGNPLQNIEKTVTKAPGIPAQDKTSKTAPFDMINRGHHPDYKG